MHGPRRGIAISRLADLLEQGGAQALYELRGDDVGSLGGLSNPPTQMIEIQFFRHDDFARR